MTSDAELLGARRIRELLRRHDVMLTKSLGQNFVIDPNTIRKVVEVAGVTAVDRVLEVGAGAGSLTLELARRAEHVTALEIDGRLRPILEETVAGLPNVLLTFGDILEIDLLEMDATRVVANLPYNIAAQSVIRILQEASRVTSLCVMTQREVGERLAAGPGSKKYGLSSVLVGVHATAALAGTVSRNVFFPVPGVDSVLVRIDRHDGLPAPVAERVGAIARAAFSQRRKTIRNSLSPIASSEELERALGAAGIDADRRAEELSIEEFAKLARALTYS